MSNKIGRNQFNGGGWAGNTDAGMVQAYALSNSESCVRAFILAASSKDVPGMSAAALKLRAVANRLETYARLVARNLERKEATIGKSNTRSKDGQGKRDRSALQG